MCRYQMSVFSNRDLQSLNNAVTRLGIPVNRAISAEQAGYCKSDSGAYNHAIKELGMPGARAAYVADHAWDIRGARPLGMAGACLYKITLADFDDSQADLEVSGPAGLGDRLTEL